MMTLSGPLLATALIAQVQGMSLQSTVVDDQGKPLLGLPREARWRTVWRSLTDMRDILISTIDR